MELPKPTGLDLIKGTLNRGSVGDSVKALQQYLNGLGYDVGKTDSVYGPKVEAAVKQYQLDNGLKSDGVFGPESVGKAKALGATATPAGGAGTGKTADDPSNMFNTDTGEYNMNFQPKTQQELDAAYNHAVVSHPVFSGNSPDALARAASTGDFSTLLNQDGKPFSQADEEAATAKASAALAPGFNAEKQFDTANFADAEKGKVAGYNDFLNTEKTNFQNDKTTLDQNAANQGVLFSGGRTQKEKALQDSYARNNASKLATTGADLAGDARNYQYKYGQDPSQVPTLSSYYQLGSNSYNPSVARGGVTPGGLSSIYNGSPYNFQGTAVTGNMANTQVRAASLLANQGNKLVATGYKNQF